MTLFYITMESIDQTEYSQSFENKMKILSNNLEFIDKLIVAKSETIKHLQIEIDMLLSDRIEMVKNIHSVNGFA